MAATAVIASSSGIPAATSAPKASTRITSVIGSEVTSAFWKSSSNFLLSALPALASPNCSIRSLGLAFCAAAVLSSVASTRSLASSSSLAVSSKLTSAERPSSETERSGP